ncbi:DUF3047 domain-containing protein [Cognatishimia activa]|uniref:DUF3047 domain-containing protein n=1 Tax=Cognatishimia activa TaxID=1715691 RepID=UPI0022328F10|nr:DUF3047 domain-containing protein [Cognatishimia activa]UZD90859.1 DUF3047 domain-containing protein [Cognatishimia activa]
MKYLTFVVLLFFKATSAFASETITFDGSWKEQGFLRLFSNDYLQRGRKLDVISDDTVSVLWKPLNSSLHSVETASWLWRVTEGVVPTDLTVKGGDDRNLAIYFVFVDVDRVNRLTNRNARRILREDSARAVVYVWGGEHREGAILPSPYSPQLRSKVLRVAKVGEYSESVDLLSDFRQAFSAEPGALIGLAVSADSDDTNGSIFASIEDLKFK